MKENVIIVVLGCISLVIGIAFALHGLFGSMIITNQTINTTISEVIQTNTTITITNISIPIVPNESKDITIDDLEYGQSVLFEGQFDCSGRSCISINKTVHVTCYPHLVIKQEQVGNLVNINCGI